MWSTGRLPFDGRAFLEVSRLLALHVGKEHCERSASSRAYYACYWRGHSYCLKRNILISPPPSYGKGSHQFLQDRFADLVQWRIFGELRRLSDRRQDADYALEYPGLLANEVDAVIRDAESLIEMLETLDAE
ncbi:hypothetical protein BH20CHL4_BH20CHL4_13890 [soil metagenome]